MKVSKITVGRGKTMGPDGEEWDKDYYTIELEISDDREVPAARKWDLTQIDGWLAEKSGKPAEAPRRVEERTIENVAAAFPEDIAGLLFFEETNQDILIKPRQYLGSENFAKTAAIVRDQLGGVYVSQKKESHFTRFEPGLPSQLDPDQLENLPWSSFREKDPQTGRAARVGRGQSGWILRKTKGAEALVDLIERQGQDTPVTMGGNEFLVRFGGEEEQFIQRRKKGRKR